MKVSRRKKSVPTLASNISSIFAHKPLPSMAALRNPLLLHIWLTALICPKAHSNLFLDSEGIIPANYRFGYIAFTQIPLFSLERKVIKAKGINDFFLST